MTKNYTSHYLKNCYLFFIFKYNVNNMKGMVI
jgi:hypothetical protein